MSIDGELFLRTKTKVMNVSKKLHSNSFQTRFNLFESVSDAIATISKNAGLTWVILMLIGIVSSSSLMSRADAQEDIWEYTPYQVKVFVATGNCPSLGSAFHSRVKSDVQSRAELVDLSAWRVSVNSAPVEWAYPIATNIEKFDFNEAERASDLIKKGDKIILVGIDCHSGAYKISAREFDCYSELWSPIAKRTVHDYTELPHEIYKAVEEAFTPIGKIVTIDGKDMTVVPKGCGLLAYGGEFGEDKIIKRHAPAWIPKDALMLPVDITTKRMRDKETKKQIQVKTVKLIEWTYLVGQSMDTTNEPQIAARMESAYRAPMGGRTTKRSQKQVRLVKPKGNSTKLFVTDRGDPPVPLQGYDIYSVSPKDRKTSTHLGKTDWQGGMDILPHETDPVRLIYVKSGSRILARLPIAPGFFESVTGQMFNDAIRIRADGFADAMRSALLDLLARRETLAVRIRTQIQKRNPDEASSLYEELNQLQIESDNFRTTLDLRKKQLQSKDRREQKHIDAIFDELTRLAQKHLTSKLSEAIGREYADEFGDEKPGSTDTEDFGK